MAWLSRNNFVAGEAMSHAFLNNLANDVRAWGGNVNGGGYNLSNVGALTVASISGMLLVSGQTSNEVLRIQGRTDATNHRCFATLYTTNPGFWWELSNESATGDGSTNGFALNERSGAAAVNRFYISMGGNVGIGTKSPGVPLEVAGAIRSYSGGRDFRMVADQGGAAAFGTYTNDTIIFVANSAEAMRITPAGNLAINKPGGTASKLAVVGLATYANNAAAVSGGLTAGDFYRTSTGQVGVVY